MDTFDWYDEEIAVPRQDPIIVAATTDGTIEIFQRQPWRNCSDCGEEISITLAMGNVRHFIRKLLDEADMEDVGLYRQSGDGSFAACSDIDLPILPEVADKAKPKDPSSAERQRRYRQRKKDRNALNGNGVTSVTDEIGSGPHE